AAVSYVQSDEGEARRGAVWARVDQLKNCLIGGAWNLPVIQAPIIPLILGSEERALGAAQRLKEQGLFVPAIRYPTVARDHARLRITLSAAHSAKDVETLAGALGSVK